MIKDRAAERQSADARGRSRLGRQSRRTAALVVVASAVALTTVAAVPAYHYWTAGAPPATVFVAVSGSDGNPCSALLPCKSFDRAYHVASPGDVVELAGGSYPSQTLSGSGKPAGASAVVFRPAAGASVSVGEVSTNAINAVEFRGMTIEDYNVLAGSDGVTFRDVDTEAFYIRSASNVSVIGGSVGGTCTGSSAMMGAAYLSSVPSTNVLIDGVRFHDITRACAPDAHVECLFVQEVSGLTVQNSSFTNCDVFDVYFHRIGIPGNPAHVVFKNNTLAAAGGYYSVMMRADAGESLTDYLFTGNRFDQNLSISNAAGSTVTNVRFCNNTGSGTIQPTTPTSGLTLTC